MGSKFKGNGSQLRALNAYIGLTRAARSTTERIHSYLNDHDLTNGQFGVLDALFHCGPLRSNEAAEKILTTGANMTTIVDNLVKRGLAVRKREENDRRCVTISLTSSGTKLFRSLLDRHVERVERELAVLTPAEQSELRRICKKLGMQTR